MDRAVKASDLADRRTSSTTALSPTATASNARLKIALLARRRHAGDLEPVISSKAAFGMCVATPPSVTRRVARYAFSTSPERPPWFILSGFDAKKPISPDRGVVGPPGYSCFPRKNAFMTESTSARRSSDTDCTESFAAL